MSHWVSRLASTISRENDVLGGMQDMEVDENGSTSSGESSEGILSLLLNVNSYTGHARFLLQLRNNLCIFRRGASSSASQEGAQTAQPQRNS